MPQAEFEAPVSSELMGWRRGCPLEIPL